jgi:single-stranded DNA-binding protein
VNKVFLIGRISEYGVTVRPLAESGSMQAHFTVVCDEDGQGGRTFQTFVPCEAFGKAREQAEALVAGALVALEGKLIRRKREKHGQTTWELAVLAWSVTNLQPQLAGASVVT